ncbi:class I SAM-dependent methyltransferase [Allomesorhizobium camelthorni]|uniref:Class I SAM-dependent methyltransferase n=1 Tax=Allomesorhizobium camelthorni TaxID=475069 RepID=A0A6G4WHW6_9HYPH|nr:class I SAM-dependent methyltransferase [Mesorhizobium camelthorni]NGO54395.1 class I SAM-dependent methyltransferase [Mesorhizobium camelthorni]
MTRLKERIAALIELNGPISVAEYMALCLFDPEDGYYTNREPFGVEGDFITAPEISQMFGELVGVWLRAAWDAIGRPLPVTVAEIGPGRGTLMKDVLRTLSRLDVGFAAKADFAMIETSPRLAEIQKETLGPAGAGVRWHDSVENLASQPLLIVGNELFDAVPIRQYIRTSSKWRERAVGLDPDGNLTFVAGAGAPDPSLLPPEAENAPEGAIIELSPARTALMETIAERIAKHGGAGLFFDYGYTTPALGDTLQALRKHRYDDSLAHPGEADLTAHVDFSALTAAAGNAGLDAHIMTQGEFLLAMGLLERAGRLGTNADLATRERLSGEVERLAGPDQMGNLFKVLAIAPRGTAVPPFIPSD